jgi:membrane dipeptidase
MHQMLPAALGLVLTLPLLPQVPAQTGDPMLVRARQILTEVPVIDGHNDFPWQVHELVHGDLDRLDISRPQASVMTDLPRLRAGGVGGQFWSVYVPVTLAGADATAATLEQIDVVHRMVAKYPAAFALALTANDIEHAEQQGKIASLIGVEGGHSINGSVGVLRMFYRLGARYMTLTHTSNTPWADSATDVAQANGLTPFGESVVREMNRLGMLVDLSHVAPSTMAAAIKVSQAPVIFSHSSARALTDVPRNVPDDILRLVATNGGVVMVTFVPGFVSQAVADYTKREAERQAAVTSASKGDAPAVKAAMDVWHAANPAPHATVAQVADHIDHVRAIAGIEHIGLGSDFDGITSVPDGLADVAAYPHLVAELLRRGYTDDDVKNITGRNILRTLRQAEAVARKLGGAESK